MKHYESVMMAYQLNDHKIAALSSHVIIVNNAAELTSNHVVDRQIYMIQLSSHYHYPDIS